MGYVYRWCSLRSTTGYGLASLRDDLDVQIADELFFAPALKQTLHTDTIT